MGRQDKRDHIAEVWTNDGTKTEVEITATDAEEYDELPFTSPNVTATRITKREGQA